MSKISKTILIIILILILGIGMYLYTVKKSQDDLQKKLDNASNSWQQEVEQEKNNEINQ
ncbi:MAG: hypothetical protein K1W33_02805 [Clostridia bacterium]